MKTVKRIIKIITIWWKTTMLDYPYWRVIYKDGKRTRLLYWCEAKGLAKTFNGKLRIDYSVNDKPKTDE